MIDSIISQMASLTRRVKFYFRDEDIIIAMPEYFRIELENHWMNQFMFRLPSEYPYTTKFEGCTIHPHYQNEVVIYYKDCVRFQSTEAGPFIIPLR